MAGKTYLKPINYTQQLQFITTFLSVFIPPTETRIKGSSSSNTQTSSSRIIKKLRKPRRTTSDNTGTTSPDVRSRSSSLGSKSNQSIHSSNSSNRSSPTSPILNPLDNTNNLLHIPKYRRSSNGSPPPYEEIIPDISLNNYRATSGSHSQSSRSSSQTIPTPMATRSAGIDMTLFSNRTGSPDLVSDMRVSNSSISRIQESLNQRGNGNELPPMPTPRMLR
ncbi:hypothetical protein G210_4201 [Candida maltosa Xu316]|uniref:Uncharacterized protein n=1 Tax=Candida maltosa (strain Xu316) TaxID=1245528 RepID=M3JS61_CANMX|nr:hypothetical protein G210_4201 [Candida maltosa Xu316]